MHNYSGEYNICANECKVSQQKKKIASETKFFGGTQRFCKLMQFLRENKGLFAKRVYPRNLPIICQLTNHFENIKLLLCSPENIILCLCIAFPNKFGILWQNVCSPTKLCIYLQNFCIPPRNLTFFAKLSCSQRNFALIKKLVYPKKLCLFANF